jgi:hypothetical protein
MNTRSRTRVLLATLWVLVVTAGLMSACSDSTTFVSESRTPSPAGLREATVAAVKQASEVGSSASYTRVTIRDLQQTEGDQNVPRVVLCTAGVASPRIHWVDESHVQLSYDAGTRLDCPSAQPPGLVVIYRAVPVVASRAPASVDVSAPRIEK